MPAGALAPCRKGSRQQHFYQCAISYQTKPYRVYLKSLIPHLISVLLDCQKLSGHWVGNARNIGKRCALHWHQLIKALSIDVAGLVVLCKVDCDLGSKTATTSTSLLCDLYFYDSWPYGLYRTVFLGNVRKWPYLGQLNFCVKTSISSRTSYFWDFTTTEKTYHS